MNDFLQAWFVNWDSSILKRCDFPLIVIYANDVVSHIREARAGHQPDISGSDNSNIHKKK